MRNYKVGDHVQDKLSGGKIVQATIKAIVETTNGDGRWGARCRPRPGESQRDAEEELGKEAEKAVIGVQRMRSAYFTSAVLAIINFPPRPALVAGS
jgi:hypothetical protein